MCEGGRLHRVHGPAVTPGDTTGAGDVFAGVLAAWMAQGESLLEAARAAAAAATYAVTRYGPQAGCPDLDEIEALLGQCGRRRSTPMRNSDGVDARWVLSFDSYEPDAERQREALLALGNGMLAVRAVWPGMPAGEFHYPGTYRAGLYDRCSAEIEGRAMAFETIVNLPNWLALRLRLDGGPPLSIGAIAIESYRHSLDLRDGISGPGSRAAQVAVVPLDWARLIAMRRHHRPVRGLSQPRRASARHDPRPFRQRARGLGAQGHR
jgi:hypothetical protein